MEVQQDIAPAVLDREADRARRGQAAPERRSWAVSGNEVICHNVSGSGVRNEITIE